MRRFFAENISMGEMRILGQEAAHISKVLRMQVGDELLLFDGSGYEYSAKICDGDGDGVLLAVLGKELSKSEPDVDIVLCQAIIKHDHFEYAIQKGTELGVKRFVPFISERCVKRPKSPERFLERAERAALEAAKQCGRAFVPTVDDITDTLGIARLIDQKYALLAYENEQIKSIKQVLKNEDNILKQIFVIIGPEGGFSSNEAELLSNAGAISVSLGKLILRAETAGVAAAAMILYECGGQL